MKANRKRLKTDLASGVKKFGPGSVVPKLGEFPLFDIFLDLANFLPFEFLDLANFSSFGSIRFDPLFDPSPPPMLPLLLAASMLAPSTSLAISTFDEMVIFSIDVSSAAILL